MRKYQSVSESEGPSERRNTQNGRQRPNDQGGTTVEEKFPYNSKPVIGHCYVLFPYSGITGFSCKWSLVFHFSNLSTDPNSPTPENRSSISVTGTYNGINPNTISYEIKRFDDTTTGGTGVKPILDEAANTFEFLNVQLNQGVNKIIVSGMSTQGQQMSATAYVKFSDVPAVYEVALSDGRVLEENASKPVVVTTQTVSISVKATNGSKGVTVNGQSMYAGGGDTYYSAGSCCRRASTIW